MFEMLLLLDAYPFAVITGEMADGQNNTDFV